MLGRICKKIPIIALIFITGVLSVSITTKAYFSYGMKSIIENIQIADYAINISTTQELIGTVKSGEQLTCINYKELGITGTEETEITFKLHATGTTTAGGYGVITIGNAVYCTGQINVGQEYTVSIKGNEETVVNVEAFWGKPDSEGTHIGLPMIGEYISVEEPEEQESSEVTEEPEEQESSEATEEPVQNT